MATVKCPSCGTEVEVPEKKSGLPWVVGCLVAGVALFILIGFIGLLAAIAIPSFVKARQAAQLNACVNNMRMIDAAKEQWALTANVAKGQPADVPACNQYIKGAVTPICPAQGTYLYHNVGEDPECSLHGLLSDPQPYR